MLSDAWQKMLLNSTGWVTILTLCAGSPCMAGTENSSGDFFSAEKLFAAHQYADAERTLENVLAYLRSRPQNELPPSEEDILNEAIARGRGENVPDRVNVHNYSIMTIELLAKCQYALGNYKQLPALMREQRALLQSGYTNTYAGKSTAGPQLYVAAFEAVAYLAHGDWKNAERNLAWSSDLKSLSSRPGYSWLGDDGSPEFARCLWLSTEAESLRKQGKIALSRQLEPEVKSLRRQLMLK
jgi:hypothetical protein